MESLLDLMSSDPMSDRNSFLRSLLPRVPSEEEHRKHPFRQMFLKEQDTNITRIVLNFFQSVRDKWPESWGDLERKGNVLPKTNGFKALMRFLRIVYLDISRDDREYVPDESQFWPYFERVDLNDDDFNIETFPPGTSGEAKLYKILLESLGSETGEAKLL